MNLNALVSGMIGAVNPQTIGTVYASTGAYDTARDGTRTPIYRILRDVQLQVQALDADELKQVDSINIEGEKRGVWFDGNLLGAVAVKAKGGDLLQFGGFFWLVVKVLETWDRPGWSHVAVAIQKDGPASP